MFAAFDFDGNKVLDRSELLRLGSARPVTKSMVWTSARNEKLLTDMDEDGDGKISNEEFVRFMDEDLPRFRPEFDAIIQEFLRIAAVARAEYLAALAAAAKPTMTDSQLRKVKGLFISMDRDKSGELELPEVVIVREEDKADMIKYLDRDGDAKISMQEWIEWHVYVFENLPPRYQSYDEFLALLEKLLEAWLLEEERRKAALSPTRTEWQRNRRQPRSPRTPRTPRKAASKSLMNYTGHLDWILAVMVVELNGQQILISASQDGTARVYDVATGDSISICDSHQGSVLSISWTAADPSNVFTGSLDGSVLRWDLMTGAVSKLVDCHKKGVLAVEAAPDAQSFFTGSRDNTAVHWGLDGQEIQRYAGHQKWIQCLTQSTDGRLLYTGSSDECVKEWDIATGACLHTLAGHSQEVTSVAISGNMLFTGSREATAKCWDLTKHQEVHQYVGHLSVVRAVGVFRNCLFTGSADGTAKCWDVETGACKFTVTGHEFAVTSISIVDGFIFTGSSDGTVRKFAFEAEV